MKPIKNKVRMKCCYYIISHNHSSILRTLLSSKSTKGETTWWAKHIYTFWKQFAVNSRSRFLFCLIILTLYKLWYFLLCGCHFYLFILQLIIIHITVVPYCLVMYLWLTENLIYSIYVKEKKICIDLCHTKFTLLLLYCWT